MGQARMQLASNRRDETRRYIRAKLNVLFASPDRLSNNEIRRQLVARVREDFSPFESNEIGAKYIPYSGLDIDWQLVRELLHPKIKSPNRVKIRSKPRAGFTPGWGLWPRKGFRR